MPQPRKLQIEESWVVEGNEESQEYSPESESPKYTPPRRATRGSERSPEPQFVMPIAPVDSIDGSWIESTSSNYRAQKSSRPSEGRRRGPKTTSSNGSPEKRQKVPTTSKRIPKKPLPRSVSPSPASSPESFQTLLDVILFQGGLMLRWCFEVFGGALRVLKTPISYILAVWLLFGVGVTLRNLITNSVYASLSPICRIPGSSLLNLPFCPVHQVDTSHGPPPNVEFDQLISVQSNFEEILEDSAGGVSLPLDMKRGEASIRDLRQLVRYSSLHSKDELVLEFDGFIETARIASYDLQKFNSHIGRAVDSVIATTRWTTRVLDGIRERDASRGTINAFINDNLLAPFQPIKFTESILLDQYIQHTRIVEEEINKLIAEAQALLMVLNNLEDRLEVIHGVATREDTHAKALKEEILSELWTMVGGNRGKLNKMYRQLGLLRHVGVYRKTAYAHISGTIIRLQAMGSGLENLRERVAAPELLRDRTDIPLSVHIETIQKGVERLEEGRTNSRKLENEHIRSTLEKGQLEGSMIDG